MRRDKTLHEISGSARIAALRVNRGRGREGVFFKWVGGVISKAGGKTQVGGLDRDTVEWQTRGSFCGRLSFDTREIIPG